ncbi:MAG: J domain-containing protein [Caulobacteraceae bacterium]
MAQDPYQELGVSRSASADEVRKSYRNLAKQLHPDRNAGNKVNEERFKRVTAAFDLLGDKDKRANFDRGEIDADGREVMRGFGGGGPRGGGGGQAGPGGFGARFDNVDLDDILGEMFGNRGGRSGFSPRGADVRVRLEIDLEDAIMGGSKRVAFDSKTLDVVIPKGAAEGQVLRLKGQGQPGRGTPGDVLVELAIRPHPLFRREGDDLHMDLPVSVPDAVLGAKVSAPTPEGAVTLTVPKHSNSGSVLRLKGRGAVNPTTGRRGDLMARLMVSLPEHPDAELERFAETWRNDRPYTPKPRR